MTLCVGDVLIITPRCPFPNWSTAHHSPNSYVAHGLVYQHLLHHSPAVLMSFCPFLLIGVPSIPCSSNASGLQRWGAKTMGDYSEDEIRLWPKTPTNILNPGSGASAASCPMELAQSIRIQWHENGKEMIDMAQDGNMLTEFHILKL